MIADLAPAEEGWLTAFFSPPNELGWHALARRAAPQEISDQILLWLQILTEGAPQTPIILPFVQQGETIRWYATTRGPKGGVELGSELQAWLGPSYLNHCEVVSRDDNDAMAGAMRQRFGGTVYRFSGADRATNTKIAGRIAAYAILIKRRPTIAKRPVRPVGAIRSDFERALLVQDSERAEALIAELRDTGRLNEENLKYLDVQYKAGLALWPQIARDHWLIRTLSDLAMPAQILADIIEALYRTYLEDIEKAGDAEALLTSFKEHLAKPYPRLFASRHGIKTPRVIKAFLLFERSQQQPDPQILADLTALLPPADPNLAIYNWLATSSTVPYPSMADESAAEDAFNDGQFDRAFALFLALPLTNRSIQRLVSCALFINTDEVRSALLGKVDTGDTAVLLRLTEPVRNKIEGFRSKERSVVVDATGAAKITSWLTWAERLRDGQDIGEVASALDDVLTWEVTAFAQDEARSQRLTDLLGNLTGEAAAVARRAVPAIYNSFFPIGQMANRATRPIAVLLFDLIALDDAISGTDLELLSLILSQILAAGVASSEYPSLLQDLADVQQRIGSYAHLPWSLDVCEMLAIAPVPSTEASEARLRFFLLLVGQTQSFAHRLERQDIVPFEFLRRDFGVEPQALGGIKAVEPDVADATTPDLSGKTIAIYTLMETAGSRARLALEEMFPGVRVDVNADTVATARLTNLAETADIFVFAWKSSSHQAYYCVKEAMGDREPIMAAGKGTASILRAVLDSLR